MVQRTYEAPDFRSQDQRSFKQFDIGTSHAQPNMEVQVGDTSWRNRLVQDVASSAGKVLNNMADVAYDALYLEGAAQAGQIKSEEELDGNPLTRDWKVAGYRDTMGKLQMADVEAQLQLDMKNLREQPPEAMTNYLSKRRAELTQMLNSLSRDQRAVAFGQLLMQDRAATSRHTAEHAKFIVDSEIQNIGTQTGTALTGLAQARDIAAVMPEKRDVYTDALQSAAATIYGNIVKNPKFNGLPDIKRSALKNVMEQTLATDNVDLYEYFLHNDMPSLDGKTSSSPIMQLSTDDQTKLASQYREALKRTEDKRSLQRHAEQGAIESALENGTYSDTLDSLRGYIDASIVNGSMNGVQGKEWYKKFADMQYKKEGDSTAANNLLSGNLEGLLNSGKDVSDGVKATERMLTQQKADLPTRMRTWLTAGRNSSPVGYTEVGKLLTPFMAQFGDPKAVMQSQHRDMFMGVHSELRKQDAAGHNNVRQSFMLGVPEEQRMRFERIMAQLDNGVGLDTARATVLEQESYENGLSPSIRAAQAQSNSAAVTKSIDSMDSRGFWETVGLNVSKLWDNAGASAKLAITPTNFVGSRDGWLSDSDTVQFYEGRMRAALRDEVGYVQLSHANSTPEQLLSTAQSNLASRSIKTSQGVLFMPRGTSVQQTFGVGAGNQVQIGAAIDRILTETKSDSRWRVYWDQGNVMAHEFDKSGRAVGQPRPITPAAVKQAIGVLDTEHASKVQEVHGHGKRVMADGVEISYNGQNTAAVPESWMFSFRDNLVKNEGIKGKPYDDLSGKIVDGAVVQTVGVGVSSHNKNYPKPNPDGTFSNKALTDSFIGASNDAAVAGARTMKATGLQSKQWFSLFAEVGYQGGEKFLTQDNPTGAQYRRFVDAARSGDVESAVAEFKRTKVWYHSRDPKSDKTSRRQSHYENLIRQAMKG